MEPICIETQRLIKNWQQLYLKDKKEDILKNCLGKILTRQEQKHIKSYSWEKNRIILGVDSSVWLYILNFKKRQLLKYLNNNLQPTQEVNRVLLKLDTK